MRHTRSLLIGTAVATLTALTALAAANGVAYAHDNSDDRDGSRHTQSREWTDYRQSDHHYRPGDKLDEPQPTPVDRQANNLTGAVGWKEDTEPRR